ncbi:hypothetical protein [Arsenicibacter rosenii]|uniref:Antitoxin Xre/MbcA/ParS-like toxin-binding domain-containing protein n=1 Tax=Arsenicibacter rosenii TaxID=1750698 RepID=A0A1S2VL59_9BACT|nr:hypothetical protein [Arsenicibacter rosenii]OIN59494.1 hypothetical protein BLX24_11040 [Arsenicibacter rosenii]
MENAAITKDSFIDILRTAESNLGQKIYFLSESIQNGSSFDSVRWDNFSQALNHLYELSDQNKVDVNNTLARFAELLMPSVQARMEGTASDQSHRFMDQIMAPELAELIWKSKQGSSREDINEVADLVGFTKKEMAFILGVSERHLYNQSDKPLTVFQQAHLLMLKRLILFGLSVFDGNQKSLISWLRRPNPQVQIVDSESRHKSKAPKVLSLKELAESPDKEAINTFWARSNEADNQPVVEQVYAPIHVLDNYFGIILVEQLLSRIEYSIGY